MYNRFAEARDEATRVRLARKIIDPAPEPLPVALSAVHICEHPEPILMERVCDQIVLLVCSDDHEAATTGLRIAACVTNDHPESAILLTNSSVIAPAVRALSSGPSDEAADAACLFCNLAFHGEQASALKEGGVLHSLIHRVFEEGLKPPDRVDVMRAIHQFFARSDTSGCKGEFDGILLHRLVRMALEPSQWSQDVSATAARALTSYTSACGDIPGLFELVGGIDGVLRMMRAPDETSLCDCALMILGSMVYVAEDAVGKRIVEEREEALFEQLSSLSDRKLAMFAMSNACVVSRTFSDRCAEGRPLRAAMDTISSGAADQPRLRYSAFLITNVFAREVESQKVLLRIPGFRDVCVHVPRIMREAGYAEDAKTFERFVENASK